MPDHCYILRQTLYSIGVKPVVVVCLKIFLVNARNSYYRYQLLVAIAFAHFLESLAHISFILKYRVFNYFSRLKRVFILL